MVSIEGELDVGKEVSEYNDLIYGMRRFLLIQGSSATIPLESESVDYVVTDPPYFDSVQYSDLAAFFRVWLRRFLPEDAIWDYDLTESAVDPHTNNGNGKYAELLGSIFKECSRLLRKEHGRLIFTFHHWNPKGWTSLSLALKRAGFLLINRHIVHSENPTSVHISFQNALQHDAILILGPSEKPPDIQWNRPNKIDKTDSRKFCEDCATALGWILASTLTEEEIEHTWINLMK
jgi:adenine-specific DNA methylase